MSPVKFSIWIIVLSLLLGSVLSIGVSPIRKIIDYEPGAVHELSVRIINDGTNDIRALVYARGDLEKNVGVVDSLVSMTKDETQKDANYIIKLPLEIERPGILKTDIVVTEYPSDFGTESGTVVSATASVVSEVWVRVPFPGKYAEAKLNIEAKNTGEKVDFGIMLYNFGKEDIQEASAKIKILGATYEEIGVVETEKISIKTQEDGRLIASWLADVNAGRYHATVEITYDGKKLVLEENFDVGNLLIDIKRINVKEFSLGDIAVFDILIESQWNDQIENVYGEITVMDKSGTQFSTFKTASVNIPAMDQALLKAYWDTANINVGTYDLRILLHYAEKVTEKLIETQVNIDSIRTELGPTAQVVASPGTNRDTILTILVIVLVLVNVGWFIFFMKKRKK